MPLRVGIDLVAVSAVSEGLSVHGDRYLARLFTAGEAAACRTAAGPDPARLAAIVAVKEATMKVLRPDPGTPLPWTDLEVRGTEDGGYTVNLTGAAAQLAAQAGLGRLSVSLTREREHAAAVVLAGFARESPIMAL